MKNISYRAAAIAALLFLTSCSSVPQVLDQSAFYKRDLAFTVNGVSFDGIGTVTVQPSYDIQFTSKEQIALLLIRSCHREFAFEKVGCTGLFGKSCFKYTYIPVRDIETQRVCPLRFEAYRSDNGKHGWAMLDFEDPNYQVPFELSCNGSVTNETGVQSCQGRVGSIQKIKFNEPIRFAPPMDGCEAPHKVGDAYEIIISKGECLYHFDTKDGKLGRLLVLGFDQILVRATQ